MSVYEKDTELKIPNWYLKLPQKILNRVSDIGIVLSCKLSRRTINSTNRKNIKFYL